MKNIELLNDDDLNNIVAGSSTKDKVFATGAGVATGMAAYYYGLAFVPTFAIPLAVVFGGLFVGLGFLKK